MTPDQEDYSKMLEEFGLREAQMARFSELPMRVSDAPLSKVVVRKSPIHGSGLFAACAIHAGEVVGVAYALGVLTAAGRYANHAKHPNAQYEIGSRGAIYQVALHDIAPDEEIVNDYRRNARVSYASVARVPLENVSFVHVQRVCEAALEVLRG